MKESQATAIPGTAVTACFCVRRLFISFHQIMWGCFYKSFGKIENGWIKHLQIDQRVPRSCAAPFCMQKDGQCSGGAVK